MIYFILPAYNESRAISALLASIKDLMESDSMKSHGYQTVVVDDGSTDDTAVEARKFLDKMPLCFLQNPENMGLARTMNRGYQEVLKLMKDPENDIIVTMDGDNTHDPEQIKAMVPLIERGSDIVIASRFVGGAQVRGLGADRKVLSQCASAIFRMIHPVSGAKDFTCGYRALRGSLLKRAYEHYDNFVSETGFSATADFLLKMSKFNPRVSEIPLDLRYDRKVTPSKMKVTRTILRTLFLLGKRRLGVMN